MTGVSTAGMRGHGLSIVIGLYIRVLQDMWKYPIVDGAVNFFLGVERRNLGNKGH